MQTYESRHGGAHPCVAASRADVDIIGLSHGETGDVIGLGIYGLRCHDVTVSCTRVNLRRADLDDPARRRRSIGPFSCSLIDTGSCSRYGRNGITIRCIINLDIIDIDIRRTAVRCTRSERDITTLTRVVGQQHFVLFPLIFEDCSFTYLSDVFTQLLALRQIIGLGLGYTYFQSLITIGSFCPESNHHRIHGLRHCRQHGDRHITARRSTCQFQRSIHIGCRLMVFFRSYKRTIGSTRILLVIVGTGRDTTIIHYPTIRNGIRSSLIVCIRIHTVEMLAIRISYRTAGLELYRIGPFARTATCLHIRKISGVRLQISRRIRIRRDGTGELTFRCIRLNILRISQRLGRKNEVPLGCISCLNPFQFSGVGVDLRNLKEHRFRTSGSSLNTDIIHVKTVFLILITKLESDIFADTVVTFEGNNYLFPYTSLRQIQRFNSSKAFCRSFGTNTYGHGTRIRITAISRSRHEGYLVVLNITVELRKDKIVIFSFNRIGFESSLAVISIFSGNLSISSAFDNRIASRDSVFKILRERTGDSLARCAEIHLSPRRNISVSAVILHIEPVGFVRFEIG